MQRLNIIKHIENETQKDLWDFQEIVIMLDGEKHSHAPLYWIEKYNGTRIENIYNKEIKRKSQIFNRLQYIKQSGYVYKSFMTTIGMEKLIIAFE